MICLNFWGIEMFKKLFFLLTLLNFTILSAQADCLTGAACSVKELREETKALEKKQIESVKQENFEKNENVKMLKLENKNKEIENTVKEKNK